MFEPLQDRVRQAAANGQALELVGQGSKRFYGEPPTGEPWVLGQEPLLSGVRALEPAELYVTVGAATPLRQLEALLAQHGQMLACEPPCIGGQGTVGGLIATGLSGPARPYLGSARDLLLGLTLIDGQGQLLKFGGTVMKNVAGFDASRLMVGAMGTLGLIAEASFKLTPLPRAQLTLRFEAPQDDALHAMARAAQQGLPLSASAWWDGSLLLRLAGSEPAVVAAATKLGGERLEPDLADAFWAGLRHQSDEFFVGAVRAMQAGRGIAIWRLSLPATAPVLAAPGEQLIEWGGAQRWLVTPLEPTAVRALARRAGGQATLYAALPKTAPAFEAPAAPLRTVMQRMKAAFDPKGVFNPGRLGWL
jgi:glycolate oxidase FAD binding subunit